MSSPSPEVVAAIGGLLQADAARVVALAASLRGPGRSVASTVQGGSMGHTLPPGARIRIALTDGERHAVGQVVAFITGNQVVVHRIVYRCDSGRGAGHVLTRGDAGLVPDPPVAFACVLGAVALEPDGAVPAASTRSPHAAFASWLLLLLAIGLLRVAGPARTATVLTRIYQAVTRYRAGIARWRRPRAVRSSSSVPP